MAVFTTHFPSLARIKDEYPSEFFHDNYRGMLKSLTHGRPIEQVSVHHMGFTEITGAGKYRMLFRLNARQRRPNDLFANV